jgi:hypothetical protein
MDQKIKDDYSYENFIFYYKEYNRSFINMFHDTKNVFPMMNSPSSSYIECMLELIGAKIEPSGDTMYQVLYWESIPQRDFNRNGAKGDTRLYEFSKYKQNFYERHPEYLIKKHHEARFLRMEQMLSAVSDKINTLAEYLDEYIKKKTQDIKAEEPHIPKPIESWLSDIRQTDDEPPGLEEAKEVTPRKLDFTKMHYTQTVSSCGPIYSPEEFERLYPNIINMIEVEKLSETS